MQMNRTVPILRIYLDRENDFIQDYSLSCASIHALMRLQPPEGIHNWGHHITILITVYCLAHSLSYSVMFWAFQVSRTTVYWSVILNNVATILSQFDTKMMCFALRIAALHLQTAHCKGGYRAGSISIMPGPAQ